jgi:hypothetical protein
MTALAFSPEDVIGSQTLAASVNTNPVVVRRQARWRQAPKEAEPHFPRGYLRRCRISPGGPHQRTEGVKAVPRELQHEGYHDRRGPEYRTGREEAPAGHNPGATSPQSAPSTLTRPKAPGRRPILSQRKPARLSGVAAQRNECHRMISPFKSSHTFAWAAPRQEGSGDQVLAWDCPPLTMSSLSSTAKEGPARGQHLEQSRRFAVSPRHPPSLQPTGPS